MDKKVTTKSGKTSCELDKECKERIRDILVWIDANPWFNDNFIRNIMHQRSYSIGQREAVFNIWNKFCNKEDK